MLSNQAAANTIATSAAHDLSNQTLAFTPNEVGLLMVDHEQISVIATGPGGGYSLDVLVSSTTFDNSTLVDANLQVADGARVRRTIFRNSSYYGSIVLGNGVRFDDAFVSNASISAGAASVLSGGIFEFTEMTGDFSGVDVRFSSFFGADLSGITGFDAAMWSSVVVDPTTTFGSNLALQSLLTVDPGLSASTAPIAATPEPSTAVLMVVGLSGLAGLGRRVRLA